MKSNPKDPCRRPAQVLRATVARDFRHGRLQDRRSSRHEVALLTVRQFRVRLAGPGVSPPVLYGGVLPSRRLVAA